MDKLEDQTPVISLDAIFGKQNEPVMLKNYLCDYLSQQVHQHISKREAAQIEQSPTITENNELGLQSQVDFQMIKQRRLLEVENMRMQMAMLAYSTLDTFDEKQRVLSKSKEETREASVEQTYLGLIT